MSLPGRCMGCGAAVEWRRTSWRTVTGGRGYPPRHVCPKDRPTCGAFMPQVKERCARRPGHAFEHRSAYAMENARRKGAA